MSGCATHRLHSDLEKVREYALPPSDTGPLHDFSAKAAQAAAVDQTHFLPLSNNLAALRWRLLLTDLAQQSIDIQYYLIDQDEGSKLLGVHLTHAADRGVRIRILLEHFTDRAFHGAAWVVYDDPPSEVLAETGVGKVDRLEDLDADISRELLIGSPYFIPSDIFVKKLGGLTKRGVHVRRLGGCIFV